MGKIGLVFIKISAILYWLSLFPIHKAHLGNLLQDMKGSGLSTRSLYKFQDGTMTPYVDAESIFPNSTPQTSQKQLRKTHWNSRKMKPIWNFYLH